MLLRLKNAHDDGSKQITIDDLTELLDFMGNPFAYAAYFDDRGIKRYDSEKIQEVQKLVNEIVDILERVQVTSLPMYHTL